MAEKPTYEELERRIQELEKIESRYKSSREAFQKSENLFKLLYEKAPLGYQSLDENGLFQQNHCIFHDITARKTHEELLERYKNIVSSTTDAIAYLDENYRYIIANDAYEDFSGVARNDFVGMTVAEYMGRDIFEEKIKPNMDRCLNGEIVNYQEWFEYPTKGKRFVDVTYFPYRDGKNHISGVIANTRDITESKQAEKALEANYAMLQIAGETARFGGWSVDLEKNICTWSDAVADIHDVPHGYSPPLQEAINFYAPEWRGKITQIFSACAKEGISYDEEMEIITQKGKRVWVRATGKAVKNEKEKIIKVQGSFQDITERKQAEAKLFHSQKLMQYIIEHTNSAVAVHDRNMHYIYVSQRYLDDYKVNENDIIGKHHYDVFPDLPQKWRDVHQKALAGKISKSDRDPYFREDGTIEWTDGRLVRMQIATDITDLKKMEAQLLQAQKLESVGRLAGGVAHDFNNMLGVILGHTELALLQADEDHDLHDDLKEIQKAAQRSADITKQLLAFARKQTISPRQLDLNDTVESLLNMLRRLIGENIDLVWKPATHLWPVKMDPTQIDQILANLCVNARDAISGVGKGTGLGLATIYGIVKQNRGFINVYSEPGQGSTFKLYLPRLSDVAEKDGL